MIEVIVRNIFQKANDDDVILTCSLLSNHISFRHFLPFPLQLSSRERPPRWLSAVQYILA